MSGLQVPECSLAFDARGEFLAMVLHELRNPLNAIQMGVDILRGADRRRQHPDWVWAGIETSIGQMTKLTDDLLDFGQATQPTFELSSEPLDLAAEVSAIVDQRRHRFEQQGLVLTFLSGPEPTWVIGDSERLSLVIGNLLDNAAKYSATDGKVVVSVVAEETDVVMRVKDNGIGIAPEFLPFVFDPFTRARDSAAPRIRGSGIGLLLVRTLVELHGGTIEAASAGLGLGSTFIVRLPAIAVTE